ncbi:ribonuclease P protein component [Geofilum sp. OHC36d9]|uniref:ribonuclease P protein component n=1 Tax=Geofilum sp. OHC36d9 TaxID=3458413 RepID=UPI0040346898
MSSLFTLSKNERLCRKKLIAELFPKGKSYMSFPLRAQYLMVPRQDETAAQLLISVPKKRFKRAVTRNLLKRRIRESYRLHKHQLYAAVPDHQTLLIAYIYADNEIHDFKTIEKAVEKSIKKLTKIGNNHTSEPNSEHK